MRKELSAVVGLNRVTSANSFSNRALFLFYAGKTNRYSTGKISPNM